MQFWIINNKPDIAEYVLQKGVNRIFLDLERIGKFERQGHLNTWKTSHKEEDIGQLKKIVPKGKLMVRLNKLNENSKTEINNAIRGGADWLILPMIKSIDDIEKFCSYVSLRVPVIPLIETKESIKLLPKIIKIEGIKEIYIGLNDLSLSLGSKFLFEPLANNILENASELLNYHKIPWGFGGIARYGEGLLPAEKILGEHVRLGSSRLILSRTFVRNLQNLSDIKESMDFSSEINKLKETINYWSSQSNQEIKNNRECVKSIINTIIN